MTVPEVRRLLWRLVWPTGRSAEAALAWSTWRRHQLRAKRCHSRTRLARLRQQVRLYN